MSSAYLRFVSGLATVIAIAACSGVPYSSRPLQPEATASEFIARSADVDGVKTFVTANGYAPGAWPPQQWGLKELTLVALYFNADIRTARARAEVATRSWVPLRRRSPGLQG